MINNNIILHGINEINEDGYLNRFKTDLKNHLSEKGKSISQYLNGQEIRFIILGEVKISLESNDDIFCMIYYGDFQYDFKVIKNNEELILNPIYNELELLKIKGARFNPTLVRILLKGSNIKLKYLKGLYKLPSESDYPKLKYLAFGTSITQGHKAILPDLTYPNIIANNINFDLLNYGMSGCCFLEKEICDFIADTNCDLYTLCLSVNMVGNNYTVLEFEKRLKYLLEKLKGKKVVLMSILTNYRDVNIDRLKGDLKITNEYRLVLEKYSILYSFPFLDGTKALSFNNLTYDLLHPGNYGMIEIAYNLLKKIKLYSLID